MKKETYLDRRSKYSMQVIRQSLFELLETKTLEKITVVDICSKADINRGTFYKYYRDVPDLYDKTENLLVEQIFSLIPDSGTAFVDFPNNLFFSQILTIISENKEFTYIAQNKTFSERLSKKLLTFFVPYLHQMLQAKCPNASGTDADLLLEYILGGCIRVVSYWLKNGMQIPINEINQKLSTFISYSISIYET